ncbi:MAG: DUF3109 family protein [Firmicutes bacterium]|nr:DUF3109 family protein [Bacillota bacterium]MCM1401848.1 DUF3109 family protein [Bacteroides sp.]MCM1477839.1 DUF3109 family protein [Bacteroides sp.]
MLQIQDTLVTLDVAEQFFICDLDKCLGECCIEGDAGAPITEAEYQQLKQIKDNPAVWDQLLPSAKERIAEAGVGYIDEEGDLVTQIVDGRNCVFTTYGPGGKCLCAIEKAYREGKCAMRKPMSCYLYPLRLTKYPTFTAVNYHRWKICRCAETLGRAKGVRLYQFMRQPLIDRFGQEWYDELCQACEAYLEEYSK